MEETPPPLGESPFNFEAENPGEVSPGEGKNKKRRRKSLPGPVVTRMSIGAEESKPETANEKPEVAKIEEPKEEKTPEPKDKEDKALEDSTNPEAKADETTEELAGESNESEEATEGELLINHDPTNIGLTQAESREIAIDQIHYREQNVQNELTEVKPGTEGEVAAEADAKLLPNAEEEIRANDLPIAESLEEAYEKTFSEIIADLQSNIAEPEQISDQTDEQLDPVAKPEQPILEPLRSETLQSSQVPAETQRDEPIESSPDRIEPNPFIEEPSTKPPKAETDSRPNPIFETPVLRPTAEKTAIPVAETDFRETKDKKPLPKDWYPALAPYSHDAWSHWHPHLMRHRSERIKSKKNIKEVEEYLETQIKEIQAQVSQKEVNIRQAAVEHLRIANSPEAKQTVVPVNPPEKRPDTPELKPKVTTTYLPEQTAGSPEAEQTAVPVNLLEIRQDSLPFNRPEQRSYQQPENVVVETARSESQTYERIEAASATEQSQISSFNPDNYRQDSLEMVEKAVETPVAVPEEVKADIARSEYAPKAEPEPPKPVEKLEQANKLPSPGTNIEQISLQEAIKKGDEIVVSGATLKEVYEAKRISEPGLRRLIAEHERGGDMQVALVHEIVEHERGFERDPLLRDDHPMHEWLYGAAGSPSLGGQLPSTKIMDKPKAQTDNSYSYQTQFPSTVQKSKNKRISDTQFLTGGLTLLLVIVILIIVALRS